MEVLPEDLGDRCCAGLDDGGAVRSGAACLHAAVGAAPVVLLLWSACHNLEALRKAAVVHIDLATDLALDAGVAPVLGMVLACLACLIAAHQDACRVSIHV